MSDVIEYSQQGAIGVITINNPPANALSFAVVKGIDAQVSACQADDGIEAMVITGAGRMFVAGADIREFSLPRPADVPQLNDVFQKMEDGAKPIVAALNGIALGGGLELAMACHYRLALPAVQVGQPEVKLGLIPGAGGTQRLARLTGVAQALDLITKGDPIKAAKAQALGILDQVVEDDLVTRAVAYAGERAAEGGAPRRTSAEDGKLAGVDEKIFDQYRANLAKRSRGQTALIEAVNCIEAATKLPFAEGLANERKVFAELQASPQSAAMRYMFFAEREVAKIPDVPRDTPVMDIAQAAIIGSGTMGGGLAMCFANAGIPVIITDVAQDALEAGLEKVRNNYASSVSRGRLSQEAMDRRMGLITGSCDLADIKDADIVIEAVFENMKLKKEILAELDAVCKPETILATNTSSLDIDQIAAATGRPDKVVGTHFFSPANIMKLMENVRGRESSKQTLATVMQLSKTLGKVGVLVGNGEGFVGNRMLHIATRVADFMLEEGALPWQIDKVIYEFGFPMGPYQMNDLAGVDIRHDVRLEQKDKYADRRHPVILDRVYALGRYGQKTKAGWYTYEAGSRKANPDPEIEKLIVDLSAELGYQRRAFGDEEILQTYLCALINQGAQVLDEGLAARASDIDVVWNFGYGFPRYRGGPMFHADTLGLDKVYAKVLELHETYGDWFKPADCLARLAAEGKGFADFKPG